VIHFGCGYSLLTPLRLFLDEMSSFSTPVANSSELLAAFAYATSNSIDGFNGQPPPPSLKFLQRVEDADPNAADFDPTDDDNNNRGWGHYQFTAGGTTIFTTFETWADFGSVEFAQQLLAATLRTCKVARHIYESRDRVPIPPSYTADAYLNVLVDRLWTVLPPSFNVSSLSLNVSLTTLDAGLAGTRVAKMGCYEERRPRRFQKAHQKKMVGPSCCNHHPP
jgi:hypothetical protein